MGSIDTLTPPLSTNASGEPRRVGVEIELDKLTVEQICDEVRAVFGGDTRFKTEFEATVETESGDFDVLANRAVRSGRAHHGLYIGTVHIGSCVYESDDFCQVV